jgi:hypothetical protein
LSTGHEASHRTLRRRLDSVPAALETAAAQTLKTTSFDANAMRSTVSTGAGGSEGPARIFAYLMQQRGHPTRFEPLSAYALHAPAAQRCILFSHGLSPNARLPLRHHPETLVVGATRPKQAEWLCHGPSDESGLLVRVVAPNVASLLAMRLALPHAKPPAQQLVEAVTAQIARAAAPFAPYVASLAADNLPFAFVTLGHDPTAYTQGMRWLVVEGALMREPPAWDILQLAHGPYQAFFEKEMLLVVLSTRAQRPNMIHNLRSLLHPRRHQLVVLEASLPYPYSWFEHKAMVGELVYALLRKRKVDLVNWPGKGRDDALYAIGSSP